MDLAALIISIIAITISFFTFILNSLAPYSIHNKRKWEELTKKIAPSDIDHYLSLLVQGHVPSAFFVAFYELKDAIYRDKDCLQFKGIAGRKALKYLKYMNGISSTAFEEIRNSNIRWLSLPGGRFKVNTDYFYEKYGCDEYEQKMKEYTDIFYKELIIIDVLYKRVRQELTKTPIEQLKFW